PRRAREPRVPGGPRRGGARRARGPLRRDDAGNDPAPCVRRVLYRKIGPMRYDVLVIGGGHAGIEAAHAAAQMGRRTALVTASADAIGRMSCNPAIGGLAKGQLVREIDALGGLMGVLADAAGIQFRVLNRSRGPAVWGPRAQEDKALYSRLARESLERTENLTILAGMAEDFTDDGRRVTGIVTED